jgi:hypothetical protein
VLGVAGLVAILTHISGADPIASYRHGLVLIVAFFAAAGLTAAALLTRRPPVPVPPAPAALAAQAPPPGGRERAGQDGLRTLGSDATTRS